MLKIARIVFVGLVMASTQGAMNMAHADDTHVSVSAPVDTDSAGRGGAAALQSVVRLICTNKGTVGTGFVHKSGVIITAAHVIKDCPKLLVVLSDGLQLIGSSGALDEDFDLGLVSITMPVKVASLSITNKDNLSIGTQVSTWGYPGGYFGRAPMLSVGYLSGVDAWKPNNGKTVTKWVVNAAFNGGNSGGPLIQIETGEVIGVVSSKLAPLSPSAVSILNALQNMSSGLQYATTLPDGSMKSFSEGQLVGEVLNELRSQIQLVIGYAVLTNDLRTFLKANNIEP